MAKRQKSCGTKSAAATNPTLRSREALHCLKMPEESKKSRCWAWKYVLDTKSIFNFCRQSFLSLSLFFSVSVAAWGCLKLMSVIKHINSHASSIRPQSEATGPTVKYTDSQTVRKSSVKNRRTCTKKSPKNWHRTPQKPLEATLHTLLSPSYSNSIPCPSPLPLLQHLTALEAEEENR